MYKTALKVINIINDNGFLAYIVGGYPRDLYLNRSSIDIDICTSATPKELKNIFKNSVLSKREYGGITIVCNNIRFEITTFRKEIKYENNRFPVKIEYINDLIEDLKRRDFTINTLCMDKEGKVLDLLNIKKDIDNKIIKTVGNTENKIKEDILRSLRAIRFATILNFKLDDELKQMIKKYNYLLKNLSYYRKKEELDKIFSSVNCKYGLELIKQLDLVDVLEFSNFDNLIITSCSIGIWAQLNVLDIYEFNKQEKELIKKINLVLKENILDNKTLYKYGLYVCTIAGEIKGIDRTDIVKKYNELPIYNKKDIDIKANEICDILNKKPDLFLKSIYEDLENKILNNELGNKKEILIKYIEKSYLKT